MITVIIATHDRPQLLQRTLMSLSAQTYKDFTTIIVSDSASYVAPYDALSTLPGRYFYLLRNDTPGPALSRNLGLKLVDTDYALFLDDDDTLEPTHLESLVNFVNNHETDSSTIFYCDFKIIEENRKSFPPEILKQIVMSIPDVPRENIFVQNVIPNSCLLFPRSVLQASKFDPTLILFEDWDYLLACLENADLCYLPINTVSIHKSFVSGDENIRRGNVNDEHLVPTTLEIYKRYTCPDDVSRQKRIERFDKLGIHLTVDYL